MKLPILLVIGLLLVGSVSASWWNISYDYRVQVNATNWKCSSSYCQFPVALNLSSSNTNGTDVRVIASDDATELGYWRETGWNYTSAKGVAWINATNNTSSFYIYYKGTPVADKSSATNVFITSVENTNLGYGSGAFGATEYGFKIIPNRNILLVSTGTDAYTVATNIHILDASKNILNTTAFSNGAATGTNSLMIRLQSGTAYYITTNHTASRNIGYAAAAYPYAGTNWNFTGGLNGGSDVSNQGFTFLNTTIYGYAINSSSASFTYGAEESSIYGRTVTNQTSNPQNSFLQDQMNLSISITNTSIINLSATTASLTYNGTTYSPSKTGNSTNITFSYLITPPMLAALTSANVSYSWFINYTQNNLTDYVNSTITVNSGGLLPCGGITNTTAYRMLFIDDTTGAAVSSTANLYTVYTLPFTSITSSYTNTTTNNWTLCIYPNMSIPITNTLTVNASGYTTKVFTDAFNVSGTLSIRTYLMSNVSAVSLVTLRVVQSPANSISGVAIKVYRLTLPSTYQLTDSCTTDAGGNCNVHLIPTTTQYVYNFTYAGTDYSFGAETVTCTTYGCFRTFTIGSSGNIPIQISLRGACSFSSSSSNLQCNATDSSATITRLTLQAYYFGNTTAMCSQTTAASSASLTCNLPNGSIYTYSFYGNDATGGQYILQTGTIDRSTSSAGFGRSGWLAALLLLGVAALMFSGNLALSIGGAVVGLFAAMLLGIIPLTGNFVAVVGIGVVALAMAYRLKV